jgi:cellulose synthase/poly-beta-1,6-N-acetylglucosamine synthase-like glycosyltransferase
VTLSFFVPAVGSVATPSSMFEAVVLAVGVVTAAAAVYLLALAIAALFYSDRPGPSRSTRARLAVLVPAHNEVDFIERCVESLTCQDYPHDRYDIVVIADNCTDETAALAQRAGARVLVRDEPEARGKGRALRWAMDRVLTWSSDLEGVVVVDADSVADPHLLRGLADGLARGCDAVQAQYLALDDDGSAANRLRAAAFLLFHRVRFAGRAVLRLPCSLVGNGMLLSRRLLESQPWEAYSGAEDLEYSLDLRLAGVLPHYASSALVRGPVSGSGKGAEIQRRRWEGGRLRAIRTHLPRLLATIVRERRASLVDAVVDLVVPPLGLLALASLSGLSLSLSLVLAGLVSTWIVVPWAISLASIIGYVLIGLAAAGASASTYRALLTAPIFLVRKAFGTFAVFRAAHRDAWIRTERPSERGA